MHPDLDGRFRHARGACGLGHRQSLELHVHDGQALALGQPFQQLRQIAPCLRGLGIGRGKQLGRVVQRVGKQLVAGAPAQQVHQLVPGDGVHPGRQRLGRVVGVALVVHRKQRFLQQILHFVRQADKTFAQVGAQMCAQVLQESVVGRRVPGQRAQQQTLEPALACTPALFLLYSLHRSSWLQPHSKKACSPVRRKLCRTV